MMRVGATLGYVLIFAATAGATWSLNALRESDAPVVHRSSIRSGDEILLVLVASSDCVAATDPAFPTLFRRVTEQVERRARTNGAAFGVVGVATDWLPEEGMAFLRRVGAFDEVVTGRNWLNSGIDHFVRAALGPMSLPQVLVVRRHVSAAGDAIAISDERIIARAVGTDGIKSWSDQGVPVEVPGQPFFAP